MVGRLVYLVDTNVWLELLLEQAQAQVVRRFLGGTEAHLLAITEFSLYSIGIILTRLGQESAFADFLSDTLEDSGITRVRLDLQDLKRVLVARKQFHLDFDDAYQYVAAARYGYTLVSFDSDFDRTDQGRRAPQEITV